MVPADKELRHSPAAPVFLMKWLHVPGEGDMGSSSQHHSLRLLCPTGPRVAVNAVGVLQVGVLLGGVTPRGASPGESLCQELAEEPGGSGTALAWFQHGSGTALRHVCPQRAHFLGLGLCLAEEVMWFFHSTCM